MYITRNNKRRSPRAYPRILKSVVASRPRVKLLPSPSCLLPPASCLLLSACCLLLSACCFLPCAQAQDTPADNWSQFRGNHRLTGVSQSNVPLELHLLWTYEAGESIES